MKESGSISISLKLVLFCFLWVFFPSLSYLQAQSVEINWKSFLEKHDLVYENMSSQWKEGAFTGNGLLGTMIYKADDNTLRIDVGRTDVYDHGPYRPDDVLYSLYTKARLRIGYFTFKPAGTIQSIKGRLNLWDAEFKAEVITDKGSIQLRLLTVATDELILIETTYLGNERKLIGEWHPEEAASMRPGNTYKVNPAPQHITKKQTHFCYQSLKAGGGYTTAWKEDSINNTSFQFITIKYDLKGNGSMIQAENQLQKIKATKTEDLIQKHRDWWHQYYPQSFITMPDAVLESFYWIQQYKLASATRANKPAMDLQGPWTYISRWPAYWMNLNIQLTYSPLYTANRLDLGLSLINLLDKNVKNLHNNAPEPYRYNSAAIGRFSSPDLISPLDVIPGGNASDMNAEVGNLTWILYYYWQHYRYSMDDKILNNLYPLLKRSINYYIHLLKKNDSGQWELGVKTYSPEYPNGTDYNTNYDLSILRWGLGTLIKISEQRNDQEILLSTWKDILSNLIEYPQDEVTGYRISQNIPYSTSHRHYSHLLMIYPFYEINWDQPENRKRIENSLHTWQSLPKALVGYSFTGKASIYAMMGKGNEARDALNVLVSKYTERNTFYLESGGPVIETPLAAAASIQELYLQYWNNTVRVFPAVPSDWKDASFSDFRTEGAFLVSAVRKDGQTKWIKIKSTVGGELKIIPGFEKQIQIKSIDAISLRKLDERTYSCYIPKGKEIVLFENTSDLNFSITPVAYSHGKPNHFGVKNK